MDDPDAQLVLIDLPMRGINDASEKLAKATLTNLGDVTPLQTIASTRPHSRS
ncbi:hypothetical protein [Salinicola avicenniae]|uniref:hypothetical protein n=1 Tax=Salinicola avicenniae TaxID=2916836 RepID=UPI0020743613|nr:MULTISPECIES: hypothetical protein [unclassified Salinicola]